MSLLHLSSSSVCPRPCVPGRVPSCAGSLGLGGGSELSPSSGKSLAATRLQHNAIPTLSLAKDMPPPFPASWGAHP